MVRQVENRVGGVSSANRLAPGLVQKTQAAVVVTV